MMLRGLRKVLGTLHPPGKDGPTSLTPRVCLGLGPEIHWDQRRFQGSTWGLTGPGSDPFQRDFFPDAPPPTGRMIPFRRVGGQGPLDVGPPEKRLWDTSTDE